MGRWAPGSSEFVLSLLCICHYIYTRDYTAFPGPPKAWYKLTPRHLPGFLGYLICHVFSSFNVCIRVYVHVEVRSQPQVSFLASLGAQELSWYVCVIYAYVCWCASCAVSACRGQRRGVCSAVTLLLIPFRQGLSLSLELGWQPVSSRDLPVSALHSARSGMYTHGFLHRYWGSKLIQRLEKQVLLPAEPSLHPCLILFHNRDSLA